MYACPSRKSRCLPNEGVCESKRRHKSVFRARGCAGDVFDDATRNAMGFYDTIASNLGALGEEG
jgi:hypothetical protein